MKMELRIGKRDWLFLGLCFLLGILAEEAFFRGTIGISYFLFIAAFYLVVFLWLRRNLFTHQRVGYLILCCIWLLAANYYLNDTKLFYLLNILVIPGLVIFHLVLITCPRNLDWIKSDFVNYLLAKLLDAVKFDVQFIFHIGSGVKRVEEDKILIWKKVGIGVLISLPILIIVLKLLMTADTHFDVLMGGLPSWFQIMDVDAFIRTMIVLFCTFAFFGFMQVLGLKQRTVIKKNQNFQALQFDAIIAVTVLILINIVYLLFTVVQFKYFFGSALKNDYTFAVYARKGFFELLFVTVINLTVTIFILAFVKRPALILKRFVQILLTVLILSSSVMLCSAFLRLSMYEEAYGFTITRVLAHSFMIFLGVIFAYTLIHIWLEKVSLFHFYIIAALLYYTVISVINLDGIVVEKNIQRYEMTGKIDIYYLKNLSATGTLGLIQLYEQDQNIPGLK